MSDTVRRALGVVVALAVLGVAGLYGQLRATGLKVRAQGQVREEARGVLERALAGVEALKDEVGQQAGAFAKDPKFTLLAAVRADDEPQFVNTVAHAFAEREDWVGSWRAFGTWSLYSAGRHLYSSGPEPTVPDLVALAARAKATKGPSATLFVEGGQLRLAGVSVIPDDKLSDLVVVLTRPLDKAALDQHRPSATGPVAVAVLGDGAEVLSGPPAAGPLLRTATEAGAEVCCAMKAVGAARVAVWVDPEPALAPAEAAGHRDRLAALGGAAVLALLALWLGFRGGKPSAEQERLLKETADELKKSREELLKLSQRISAPGMTLPGAVSGTAAALDQTAASVQASRYEVIAPLGEGGMARVVVAQVRGAEGFRRTFVVKRLRPELSGNAEVVSQFIDEARLGASLVHSNIVPVFDFGRDAEGYYLAQEYIIGRDLDAVVQESKARRGQPLESRVVLYVAQEALKALSYAHTKRDDQDRPLGLVHRDVSPNNLMMSARGELKLLDFGIVKSEARLTKTQTGVVKGNLFFMSPEQARALPVDRRSDLFSLGLVLYAAATGDTLYHGQSNYDLLTRAGLGLTPEDFEVVGKLPGGLGPLLAKALQFDPAARYQSADEFAQAVAQVGPVATSGELHALMELLFKDALAAEVAQLSPARVTS